MQHNKFRVIVTGRFKKHIDEAVAAERIGKYSEITPTQALALIQSRQSQVLVESIEHAKAYQIKRFLQDSGVEIKLEPTLTYYVKPVKEKQEDKNKSSLLAKIVQLYRRISGHKK